MSEVLVVPTGVANLASVLAGLRRAGAAPEVARDPTQVREAPRVVLPGVGTFGAALERLRQGGLAEALRARIEGGRPTLAVCVGLQVLAAASEESAGAAGLALLAGTVRRFPRGVRVPQFGWNRVAPGAGARFLTQEGYAYFANSYRLTDAPPGWVAATADHGGPFVAALERGAVLACQFHPELSGAFGAALLRRWVQEPPC